MEYEEIQAIRESIKHRVAVINHVVQGYTTEPNVKGKSFPWHWIPLALAGIAIISVFRGF